VSHAKTTALAAAVAMLGASPALAQTVPVTEYATYTDGQDASLTGALSFSFDIDLSQTGTYGCCSYAFAITDGSVTIGGQTYLQGQQDSEIDQVNNNLALLYLDVAGVNLFAELSGSIPNLATAVDPNTLDFTFGTLTVQSAVALEGGACETDCTMVPAQPTSPVPEPGTLPLVAAAVATLPALRRRAKNEA
jgi:hypothetical protein